MWRMGGGRYEVEEMGKDDLRTELGRAGLDGKLSRILDAWEDF